MLGWNAMNKQWRPAPPFRLIRKNSSDLASTGFCTPLTARPGSVVPLPWHEMTVLFTKVPWAFPIYIPKHPTRSELSFALQSLSKQFTAAAVFRLAAAKKLSIDDQVHQHLPEFSKAPYRDITIHHLLTHTSGLPKTPESLLGKIRWSKMSREATPVQDYVELAVQTPLMFKPGSRYEYSNFGYRVLSALIARVSGLEYADFMQQEVFNSLNMNDTGVAHVTRGDSEASIAEGLSLIRLEPQGPVYEHGERGRNFGTGYGSGGIFSSAHDLVLWDRALRGNDFLSKHQKQKLFLPVHDDYACGWKVKQFPLSGHWYQYHSAQ